MFHSITIGDKNTWADWRLVPVSRPVFNPPPQKKVTVDIPAVTALSTFPKWFQDVLFSARERVL